MAVLAAYGVEKSEQQVASALGKLTKLSWYVCNPLILLPAAVYRCVPGIDGELPLTNMLSYRLWCMSAGNNMVTRASAVEVSQPNLDIFAQLVV